VDHEWIAALNPWRESIDQPPDETLCGGELSD
jgi:hypothetical protein